ncbi:MAG: hypothetical protein Q8Q54_09140 [Methylococcales bacterium]|nr:hypothetical protein [Methylococcales bacterium]MDP3839070.1 hypothetical protein [Methylococcales bacterium]
MFKLILSDEIDGDVLLEQYVPSRDGLLTLPLAYTAQAIRSYNAEDQNAVALAWSFIADAQYYLGFLLAAGLGEAAFRTCSKSTLTK